jgi:hypothetical protein
MLTNYRVHPWNVIQRVNKIATFQLKHILLNSVLRKVPEHSAFLMMSAHMQTHSKQDQTEILVGLFHNEPSSLQGALVF